MKYKNIDNFNLIKLNVPNILKAIEAHISSKGSNTTSNATIDISQERDLMTNGVYSYPANALYDQICACLISDFNTPNDSFDADSLQNIVFHADFSGVKKLFTHDNTQETQNNKKNTLQHKALKHMLTNGFILKLSDVKSITLTPFDKSGSMSRTYRMTFIDSSFIEKLNKRLLLDMDFSKLDNVVRSKFYAYKGLYLSEGKRTINDKLLFDYSKVIVIKDYQYKVTEKQTISNSKTDNNTLEIKQSSEALDINSFDGEGIISPYYSDIINSVLEQTNASSYQILMPFVKGVLHKVDFKKFILEELYEDNKNLQELYVEDLFGIKRNIFEAEIILTSSMLKNHSWIKNFLKNSNNDIDPMAFYFDAFNKYNHSLYVVKTNNSLPSQNYVPLNYQFLNTLDISSENFEKLINKHAERIISLKSDREELKKLLKASPDSKDPHLKALSYNDAFFDDSKITTILNSKFKSLTKDIATGRLSVRGIERFLSGDLMYFMLNIAKNINDNNENKPKSKQLENIKENTINSSEMFIPGSKNALDGKGYKYGNSKYTNTYYAILRNPHLSRHEQALLTLINENTYYKRNGKNTPYKSLLSKYFSDLTGIVMVSANSTIPLTIGGADFDGDEVKIIGEELVIKAIADGAYAENQEKGRLVRKLAVPYIKGGMAQPSHKSDPTATDDEYFETIINTFGNSV
ncbi:MAG: hypothetical protein IKL53_08525, partial [Lachnospiraceae bacterium]|nr:hypothetical protein [Lachnospiraceae bacterium]